MRKFLASSAMFFVFAALIPVSVSASSGKDKSNNLTYGNNYNNYQRNRSYRRNQRQSSRRYYNNRSSSRYSNRGNYRYGRDRRSVYRRHRNAFNIGIGGASGAILGGILGGKRGALIGAGVGAGAGAAYTYGIRPKKKRSRYSRRY